MLHWLIFLTVIIAVIYYKTFKATPNLQPKLDAANATLYGANWCHYTLLQQRELQKLNVKVKYIECSGKNKRCKNITAFPTWQIEDQMIPGYMDADALVKFFN